MFKKIALLLGLMTSMLFSLSAQAAVNAMRSVIKADTHHSQRASDNLGNQRPWVKNQPISTTTATAHSQPMLDLA